MGVISSTMRIVDAGSSVIQRNINMMSKMVDIVEKMNSAGNMPGLETAFNEIRADISLANRELEVFNQSLQDSGEKAAVASATVSSGFGFINKAIIVANQGIQLLKQGYQELQHFMDSVDTRTGADARLALIRDELRMQEQLEAQVMAVANATRTSYETTAELVAKMGRQDYFKNQNDKALAFAKTINQALIVSGASSAEANSAILQLSQGIASGVLRGEEFNAIMENGSVLAEMMAASLNITKGELRAMAQDGMLTTDVVVSAIMQQADAIDAQFSSMPVRFGQVQTQISNLWSQILNDLSQTGQPIDSVILKMQELYTWLNTIEGQQFMTGLASGIGVVFEGSMKLAQIIGEIYLLFNKHWSTIEPILVGIGIAVGGLVAAYAIYNGIQWIANSLTIASAIASGAKTVALGGEVIATTAAAQAQWGLNAALLACPATWVIVAIVALIAIVTALLITNIDFRVKFFEIWNSILGFFDQVPIFFQMVGNGVLDAFSYMKVGAATILQNMINDTIAKINTLISFVNMIPGVSIDAVSAVDFTTSLALEEEAKSQSRADSLQDRRDAAGLKAAERENKLAQDAARWRLEAAEKEVALKNKQDDTANLPFGTGWDGAPLSLGGGKLDKVGKIEQSVDISNQSLAYLRDIAELQALESVNAYHTVAFDTFGETRLSKSDADLLKSSAGGDTKVYYLNYSGGVRIKSDVHNGQDWESIKQDILDETDAEMEVALAGVYEVLP